MLVEWIPAAVAVLIVSTLGVVLLVNSSRYYRRLASGEKRTAITRIVDANEFRSRGGSGYFLSVWIEGRKVYKRENFPLPKGEAVRVNYTVMSGGEYILTGIEPVDQIATPPGPKNGG